jgi:hypothetical protein
MYGDMTEDMTDDDVQLVEDFIGELAEQGISLIEPIEGTENEFNSHPAFGQPCGTVDWSCTVD